jgi:hypothetical protein
LVFAGACLGGAKPATRIASPTPVPPQATATVALPPKGLTGVFDEPRATVPDRIVTPPAASASPFSQWDGKSTVIYDVKTGKEMNLGPGGVPSFSPDSTRAIWIAGEDPVSLVGGEARLIDLTTGSVTSLGPGRGFYPRFLDDNTVAFPLPDDSNSVVSVDLRSGARSDISGNEATNRYFERLDALRLTTPDGYRVSWQADPTAPRLPRSGSASEKVMVADTRSGQVALAFDAFAASPAGSGYVVVASKAKGQTVNLFLVEIAGGQAQFIATTRWSGNFPLVADDNRVVWIDNFCGDPPGNLEVYDRTTKQLTEVTGVHDYVRLTPSGQLALGAFGARSLMDPVTFATGPSLPASKSTTGASDVSWSDDYRYAAHGLTGGHGGLC